MPVSAVTGRAEIVDSSHVGGVGGTYGGAPVACAAALQAIERIRQPAFLERARAVGDRMRSTMTRWQEKLPLIGDVRGLGAMMLMELVLDRKTRAPAAQQTLEVIRHAAQNGLVLIRAGLFSNCVRLLPPLMLSDEDLDEGLGVLGDAVRAIQERHTAAAAG